MSNDIRRDFLPYLEANGFKFHRSHGKHHIYTNGKAIFPMPTGKITSFRMMDYLRSELRKVCKQTGREFTDLRYPQRKEKEVFQNTPRLREEPQQQPTQLASVPQKAPTKKKQLDNDALEFCKMAKAEGWSQFRMAEGLNQMGYESKEGNPITNNEVSKFMRDHGIRSRVQFKRPGKSETKNESMAISGSKLLHDVKEIISSKMADETKETLLIMYFNNRKG